MTANNDYVDFTTAVSRLMSQLSGSPLVSITVGWQSVSLPVDSFARSLNLMITGAANIISLSVTGDISGFVYLNAVPVYDGGLYYLPVMSAVDTSVTVTWYQVTTASVSLYLIESDEPISVSMFNPVAPTEATSERLLSAFPAFLIINALNTAVITLDVTTVALRITVSNDNFYLWGKVVGNTSGKVYYDGSTGNHKFPLTPIPVDRTLDSAVTISLQTFGASAPALYVAAVNVPDFAGNLPLSRVMASNELGPDPSQSERPNQLPAIFDGTIAASATQHLIAATAGRQIRLHYMTFFLTSAVSSQIVVQDTSGQVFYRFHVSGTQTFIPVDLQGQVAANGAGIDLQNAVAAVTGVIVVVLWYSML